MLLFWEYVDFHGPPSRLGLCWVWTGERTTNGYGRLTIGQHPHRIRLRAHRLAFEAVNGPIPHGLEIDHLCRNRLCVNPSHLEVVTHQVNMLRSPVAASALNAVKLTCPLGHPYTPENTRRKPNRNSRECRICRRSQKRAYNARKRARA